MAPFAAGILLDEGARCKRLAVCAKGAPALSLQCASAPPSVLAGRSWARFADAGVPGLLLLLCFASGLELPQMRALSIAVAIALRRHVRSCSPRVLHHTHPVDLACFVQVSMSAIQRGAVVVWHAVLPLENSVVHKIFSRGCAPHPLSLETRFSLYHIKVLHLLANRLGGGPRGPNVEHRGLSGVVGGEVDVGTARGSLRRPVVGWLQLL